LLKKEIEFLKNIRVDFTTLYVEDNEEIRLQTINILNNFLPKVISASNGADGIELYKKYKDSDELKDIDLIISDIEMPKQNGLEMLAQIKEINPTIAIIIISAYSNTEYFLEAINIGIDNYLLKPYTSDEISSVLFKTIKKQYDANIHDVKNACNLIDNNLIYIGYGYSYNFIENLLFYKDSPVKLSKKETTFFKILLEAKGSVVSAYAIECHIWPDTSINNHSLRALVYRLRAKLNCELIETLPSFGYRLSFEII